MVSDMDAMCSCIFNLCDVRVRVANLYCAQGLLQGSSSKKKSVYGGSFYQGEVGNGRDSPG